jgi:hypothetical protein
MTHVIRLLNLDGRAILPEHRMDAFKLAKRITSGNYLEWADVEAFDGGGDATFTADPAKAMKFESFEAATEFWRQSERRPFRADGKPNRPLTTFTVTIEALP